MDKKEAAAARRRLQNRVASAVWGLACIVMGGLFTLDNLGRIDLGERWRHSPSHAVDGDPATRWSSAFRDPQWITVDLGAPAEITRVQVSWEAAYAREYDLEVSTDGTTWTTAKSVTDGHGGTEDHELSATGRYLRLRGTKRSTPWGYSLWELEVYGRPGTMPTVHADSSTASPVLLSRGMPATASSVETSAYWFLFWPVFLIASGLPLLLAPKDGGEQVIGLVMTGVGAFFQLQNLGLVSWSFSRAWPVLLIVAGFLMVLQAVRQMTPPPTDGDPMGGVR